MSDLLCLSQLRWSSAWQRPRHVMARLSAHCSVFFFEEPMFGGGPDRLEIRNVARNVVVLVPWLSDVARAPQQIATAQRGLLHSFLSTKRIASSVLWYCSPAALAFTSHLAAELVVYDCVAELPRGGEDERYETDLLRRADLVFTADRELHAAHQRAHLCPSGVDLPHFGKARERGPEPRDQAELAGPKIGYAGSVDTRVDLRLIAELAERRPELHLVMLGAVNAPAARLPRAPNIHWLGKKPYAELPAYLAHWDAALIPFTGDDTAQTRGAGKALEALAAGKPVVSTPLRDVLTPYAARGLVHIADSAAGFARAIDRALRSDPVPRRAVADALLADLSWDRVVTRMRGLLDAALLTRRERPAARVTPT